MNFLFVKRRGIFCDLGPFDLIHILLFFLDWIILFTLPVNYQIGPHLNTLNFEHRNNLITP